MQERMPLRVWPSLLCVVPALLAISIGSALLIVAALTIAHGPDAFQNSNLVRALLKNPLILLASVVLSSTVFAVTAFSAAHLSPEPWKARLSLRRPQVASVTIVLVMLAAPALGQVLETIVALSGIEVDGTLKHLSDSIASASGWQVPAIVIAISLGPGIGEELLFRGYIQTRLTSRWGARLGIAIASLLFGAMHLDPVHSVLAAILGVYLGFVADRFHSIIPSILAHAFNNMTAALMIFLAPPSAEETPAALVVPGIVSAAFFAFCVWWIVRATPRADVSGQDPSRPADSLSLH